MIKNLTRGRVHKTSLFVQPDYKCNLGCKGCYALKAGNYDATEFIKTMTSIELAVKENMAEFDQVTISFNDLDKGDATWSYHTCKTYTKKMDKEKVHYACSVNSIDTYADIIDFNECSVLNISIDISKWDKLNFERRVEVTNCIESITNKYPDLHININFLIDEFEGDEVLMLHYAESISNSVHFIMNKPIKDLFNDESLGSFRKAFENYIKITLRYSYDLGDKVMMDACVKTLINNLLNDTEYTCRAGVDHASLWPDGKLTGCPYRMTNTKFDIGNEATVEFNDHKDIKNVKVDEFELCLYNKLSAMYGSFDELCESLKLEEAEINKLKSLV